MKVVIVGGKLQGCEASYLAHKAGWEVYLVDRKTAVPAYGLCDYYSMLDIEEDREELLKVIKGKDFVVPAFEDEKALAVLVDIANTAGVPVMADLKAYALSSSKLESDKFFADNDIPAPKYWPDCSFPIVAKPSDMSGSSGVHVINDASEMVKFEKSIDNKKENWVIQEYLSGPSYSMEVIGFNGNYLTLQTTEIIVDRMYDCKRVIAPLNIPLAVDQELRDITLRIAKLMDLNGIMDVEVIDTGKGLRVLEIDARLPSQTPTAVYKSTGINMLEVLAKVFVYKELKLSDWEIDVKRHVIYEHICVTPDGLETLGEHIMTVSGPLSLQEDFFGADEALTSYSPGRKWWVATLIITAEDVDSLWEKRNNIIKRIQKEFDLAYVYS